LVLHSADPAWENKSFSVPADYADPATENLLMLLQGMAVEAHNKQDALAALSGPVRDAVVQQLQRKEASYAEPVGGEQQVECDEVKKAGVDWKLAESISNAKAEEDLQHRAAVQARAAADEKAQLQRNDRDTERRAEDQPQPRAEEETQPNSAEEAASRQADEESCKKEAVDDMHLRRWEAESRDDEAIDEKRIGEEACKQALKEAKGRSDDSQQQAEEEAKLRCEENAGRKGHKEEPQNSMEEARQKAAEEDARRTAEQEARLRIAADEARKKAAVEAEIRAEREDATLGKHGLEAKDEDDPQVQEASRIVDDVLEQLSKLMAAMRKAPPRRKQALLVRMRELENAVAAQRHPEDAEEAKRMEHEEAERRACEEAEQRAHEEAEQRAHEEAECEARKEAERSVHKAARRAHEETAPQECEEAKQRAPEDAVHWAREEPQHSPHQEAEYETRNEAKRGDSGEAKQQACEEAEESTQEVAERRAQQKSEGKLQEQVQHEAKEVKRRAQETTQNQKGQGAGQEACAGDGACWRSTDDAGSDFDVSSRRTTDISESMWDWADDGATATAVIRLLAHGQVKWFGSSKKGTWELHPCDSGRLVVTVSDTVHTFRLDCGAQHAVLEDPVRSPRPAMLRWPQADIDFTVCHASEEDIRVKVVLPFDATFHDAKKAVAKQVGSDDIIRRGRLVRKKGQAGLYVACKDASHIGQVREVFLLGADLMLAPSL